MRRSSIFVAVLIGRWCFGRYWTASMERVLEGQAEPTMI
jgi:hypothetical protein